MPRATRGPGLRRRCLLAALGSQFTSLTRRSSRTAPGVPGSAAHLYVRPALSRHEHNAVRFVHRSSRTGLHGRLLLNVCRELEASKGKAGARPVNPRSLVAPWCRTERVAKPGGRSRLARAARPLAVSAPPSFAVRARCSRLRTRSCATRTLGAQWLRTVTSNLSLSATTYGLTGAFERTCPGVPGPAAQG